MPKKELPSGRIVVYLGRQQVGLYDPQQNQVFGFEFPKEIVSDVTVLNDEEYKKLISRALAQYKIGKQKSLIVLSKDIYFTRPITDSKAETGEVKTPVDQLSEWRDAAPFANVYAKLIKQPQGQLALAASRDFFEPLLHTLNELGYSVTTLVPELVVSADFSAGLTPEIGALLSAEVSKLGEFNFLESEEKPKSFAVAPTAPEDKKRTWILAVVFGVLLLVLGLVYWYVNVLNAPKPPIVPAPMPVAPIIPTVAPVLEDPLATNAAEVMTETETEVASNAAQMVTPTPFIDLEASSSSE